MIKADKHTAARLQDVKPTLESFRFLGRSGQVVQAVWKAPGCTHTAVYFVGRGKLPPELVEALGANTEE